MLKSMRMLIVGLIAGAILATAGSSFAATALQKVTALIRPDYNVKVDGQNVKMQSSPLTYNGTTYIPLREAGTIFGYDVGFNAGTITLDQQKEETSLPETTTTTTPTSSAPVSYTFKLGESADIKGVQVTVDKVEYATDSDLKVINVHFSVTNNSDKALVNAGRFSFKLSQNVYEDELNRKGYTLNLSKTGYLYPGESTTGYYSYTYDRDVVVNSVVYTPGFKPEDQTRNDPTYVWVNS